jgi:hypothetical protein
MTSFDIGQEIAFIGLTFLLAGFVKGWSGWACQQWRWACWGWSCRLPRPPRYWWRLRW